MKLPRPSILRRVTLAFILGPIVAILILLVAMRPIAANEPNIAPEVATVLLAADLRAGGAGRITILPDSNFLEFAHRSPRLWFVARGEERELSFGPVPPSAKAIQSNLPPGIETASFNNVGASGRLGDATLRQADTAVGRLTIFLGGVDPAALDVKSWILFAHLDEEFYMGLSLIALICLFGAPFAVPAILSSIRPTAKAALNLDPSDLTMRLPEEGVVKELLPLVRALNGALSRVADAFERRRRFIADVAHELRTPLAVLNMHVDALPEAGKKPELQRTVFRLGQMVGQMLDAERLTLGERRHDLIDLVELSKNAVADVAPLAVSAGYELAFSGAEKKVPAYGDAHAVTRAVANLLGNAIAHGGGTGTIEVKVTKNRTIDVSDQGEGIPPEAWEQIFEPFHRERWDKDGCGLGLHLVREIMRAHGGKARVVRSGPGTIFRLEFPPPPPTTPPVIGEEKAYPVRSASDPRRAPPVLPRL